MNIKNKSPQVSIVMPTYNRARLIARAINSILEQNYVNFEIIVIDDCSTDDTARVIAGFNDSRIKYIYLSQHKGAAFARNEGLKIAFGELIAFCDTDDLWVKDKLTKQVQVLLNAPEDIGLVYSAVWKVSGRRKVLFPDKNLMRKRSGDVHKHLLFGNFVTIHVLIRKQCLERVGMFDEKLPRLQDWDLWLRLSKKYKFFYLNEPLATVFKTADAISEQSACLAAGLEIIINKFLKEFSAYPNLLAKYYYSLGRGFYKNGQKNKSQEYLEKALELAPYDLKYMFYVWLFGFLNKKQ
jgi:glycosyltransferase involved in cell wall biosynthesis